MCSIKLYTKFARMDAMSILCNYNLREAFFISQSAPKQMYVALITHEQDSQLRTISKSWIAYGCTVSQAKRPLSLKTPLAQGLEYIPEISCYWQQRRKLRV